MIESLFWIFGMILCMSVIFFGGFIAGAAWVVRASELARLPNAGLPPSVSREIFDRRAE